MQRDSLMNKHEQISIVISILPLTSTICFITMTTSYWSFINTFFAYEVAIVNKLLLYFF